MLEISCSGTPYEIGHTHGRLASPQVQGSLSFYRSLFATTCDLDWDAARSAAQPYLERLSVSHPAYVDEMRGLADGVVTGGGGGGVDLLDVVVLNVRTEIAFGLFTLSEGGGGGGAEKTVPPMDGCTALGCNNNRGGNKGGDVLMAQNWDWQVQQSANLVVLHITHHQHHHQQPEEAARSLLPPEISMVTEAGIIGKIGLNSAGVGVCQNAIRARGLDDAKLPVHLAMRMVLECRSRVEAVERLRELGTAGSVHLLIGDPTGVSGVECTSLGVQVIHEDGDGKVVHTNHLVLRHENVDEPPWLDDSGPRLTRIGELMDAHRSKVPVSSLLAVGDMLEMLKDEESFPVSINRRQVGGSEIETLFSIAMNLSRCSAEVTFGRPTEVRERVVLAA